MITIIKFYMGANTPQGFYSLFDGLYNSHDGWTAYVIKGGPGTGKSGLLRRVGERAAAEGLQTEWINCSSDPQSLDAIILPEVKVCLADGTSPHVIEPQFPGAVEQIIHLGDYWNRSFLRENAEAIIDLTQKTSACHKRCIRFLGVAGSIRSDIARIAVSHTDTVKAERFATRFSAREFGAPRGKIGKETRRFLSVVSPNGVDTKYDTMRELCDRIIVLDDGFYAASNILLDRLRCYALGNGLDVISCLCPLAPTAGAEHLILPQLRLGIFTANEFHKNLFPGAKQIHASRFMSNSGMKENKHRLAFNKKTMIEMTDAATNALCEAKKMHDALERFYVSAMNFDQIDKLADEITDEILQRKCTKPC